MEIRREEPIGDGERDEKFSTAQLMLGRELRCVMLAGNEIELMIGEHRVRFDWRFSRLWREVEEWQSRTEIGSELLE